MTGPRQTLVTFRKSRVLGIWVNTDSRIFENAPAYLAVLANRPLDAIASPETLQRLQLGLDNFPLPQRTSGSVADTISDDQFRAAFLKLKTDAARLYREVSNGVTFLTPALFRASIPLPATVPVGNYEVDVRLFVDGAAIARTQSALEVYKAGFEQIVTNAARNSRPAVRHRHRHDGAGHRLVRQRRVPPGLDRARDAAEFDYSARQCEAAKA